jgi:tetratricopeptide (TPR) repeat protein
LTAHRYFHNPEGTCDFASVFLAMNATVAHLADFASGFLEMNATVADLAETPAAAAATGVGQRVVPWQVPAVRDNDTPTTLRLEMPSVRMSVPVSRVGEIVGRESTVKQVVAALAPAGARVLVYGPPGVGKDTVMAEVAHSIDVQSFGGLQAWLQASSDAVLRRQLIELFATHRPRVVAGMDNDANAAIAAIKQWLATHKDWVLFVEDAGPSSATVWDVLPGQGVGGRVLVTSQAALHGGQCHHGSMMFEQQGARIELAPITADESVALLVKTNVLSKKTPSPPDGETENELRHRCADAAAADCYKPEPREPESWREIKQRRKEIETALFARSELGRPEFRTFLKDTLGNLPLSVALCGHMLRVDQRVDSVFGLIALFKRTGDLSEVDRAGRNPMLDKHYYGLALSVRISLDRMRGDDEVPEADREGARALLAMMSLLDRETTPTSLFLGHEIHAVDSTPCVSCVAGGDDHMCTSAECRETRQLCILLSDSAALQRAREICIRHGLLQDAVHAAGRGSTEIVGAMHQLVQRCLRHELVTTSSTGKVVSDVVRRVLLARFTYDSFTPPSQWPAIRRLAPCVEAWAARVYGDSGGATERDTALPVPRTYSDGPRTSVIALPKQTTAVAAVQADGELLSRWGMMLLDADGDARAAERVHEMACALRRRVLPPTHPEIATSMSNLALTYSALGRHQDALKMNEEALAARRDVLPPTHPEIATSMSNLALTYSALGRHQDALKMNEEALAFRRRVLPPDHADVATLMNNLALTYSALGRHKDALKMNEDALAFRRDVLPPTHPEIATSMSNLASMYSALGRHEDALKLEEEVLAFRRCVFPSDHPIIGTSIANLAAAYRALGRDQDADDLERSNAVQEALKEAGTTFAPLRRAKVILCGQGRVGKTSLRKALTGLQFDEGEASTAGAQVTCALRRVEAGQADGEWSVLHVDRSSWEGQCVSEAELTYLTRRYGTDAAAWAARNTEFVEHANGASVQSLQSAHDVFDDVDDDDDGGVDSASVREREGTPGMVPAEPHSGLSDDSDTVAQNFETDTSVSVLVPSSFQLNFDPADDDVTTVTRHLYDKEARIAVQLAELENSKADLPIKVSVWDLGGQRLFQALQQMFLTKSAIYVVTFCLTHFTAEASEADDAAAELRFWCDTVASCAMSNNDGEPGRIVVVGTCLDQIASEGEGDAAKQRVDAAKQRAADVIESTLLRGVISVDDIFCVDNSRRDGSTSIAGLRGVLDKHISESSDVTVPVRDTHYSCKR